MTIIDNEMLLRQFEVAIDMLGAALRDCGKTSRTKLWHTMSAHCITMMGGPSPGASPSTSPILSRAYPRRIWTWAQ